MVIFTNYSIHLKQIINFLHSITSIRILPHHQDTGGFFVTVLEKVKPLPWETNVKESEIEADKLVTDVEVKDHRRKQKKRRYQGYKEDPFVFLNNDDPVWPEIRLTFFNLDLHNNFTIRTLFLKLHLD